MVGKVHLQRHHPLWGNGAYALIGGEELSDAERNELLQLCRQRIGKGSGEAGGADGAIDQHLMIAAP